jgi:hypothetical protein
VVAKSGFLKHTYGLQRLSHDLRPVVDGEHDIGNAGVGQGLDLMLDHGLVRKLDERLGVSEGLLLLGLMSTRSGERGVAESYQRPQAGSKPSDENNGCMSVSACAVDAIE